MAIAIHAVALLLTCTSFANIKNITPKSDEIIEIKTALGIATIIQMPDTIQSAIMGDQSAYRIEYVDHAVTIKPLRGGAKTNLYLFTKEKRYNLRLIVVPQNVAYYVVYVKKQELGNGPKWTTLGRAVSNDELTMKLVKVGQTSDGFLILDIAINAKKALKLDAGSFWVYEGNESRVIHSLFISKPELKKDQFAFIGISIKRADFGSKPLFLQYKEAKTMKLEVSKVNLWR